MVERSNHYKERYSERVCSKTKREELFVNRAYYLGKDREKVKDARLKRFLLDCEDGYGTIERTAKAYNGQVYIFANKVAVTVFPLPNKLRSLA